MYICSLRAVVRSIPEATTATATFLAKAPGVVAGLWVANAVFLRVDPSLSLRWLLEDGEPVVAGQTIGVATGSARSILVAERVALNFMQRMSGIASLTAQMVQEVEVKEGRGRGKGKSGRRGSGEEQWKAGWHAC
jgi:nicotinate-nucleotide pyrophosphorylase (carboxylating)